MRAIYFKGDLGVNAVGGNRYDSSGTLIYLETFSATNSPPTEFYRATLTP